MLGRFEEDSGYERSGHGVPPSYFFLGQDDVEGRDSDEDEYERHYILDDEGSDCPYLQAGKIVSQCIENRYSGRRTEGQEQKDNEERNKEMRYEEMADE